MKLHFLGGARVVSGNSYLLEAAGKKLLVDCGMFQGINELEEKNRESFSFDPKEIDFVIITHSHLDHIGRLPMLVDNGFRGKIFATPPTIDFTHLMLEDTKKVMEEKARKEKIPIVFSEAEIDEIMRLFVATEYHQKVDLGGNIFFEFYEAGHILGSTSVKMVVNEGGKETKIVFSGDLGSYQTPILRPYELIEEADYILIESTYGDRLHEKREETKNIIEDAVEEAISRKGVLMIPSFAMERSQQILFDLNELFEHKRVPFVPVFIDSPLAIAATKVYEKYSRYFSEEARDLIRSGDDIFRFKGLKFTPTVKESKQINDVPPPKIIIAGSGMSQGGRIMHHEIRYLPDANNILLLVTYQAEGTLGREILSGRKEVIILDQKIPVRARVETISGYSAHADQKGLIRWLSGFRKPIKKVFVIQGEEKPSKALAQIIKDNMGIEAEVPKLGEVVELE